MIEQYTSPVAVNNSQEPWLVGEGVVVSGGVAIPSLDFNFITGGLPGTVTFTRASTATYFDATGTLQSAAINTPRFDYNPATLAARGFLIEESRTNILLQSGWAGAVGGSPGTAPTSWALGSVTGTPTTTLATSIYGTADSAQAVLFSGVTGDRLWYQQTINVTSGTTYTTTIFCETITGSPGDVIQVVAGTATRTIVSNNALNPTSGSRASVVFTATSTGTIIIRYGIGTGVGIAADATAQLSRPQVEAGAFATSYIPTTTTALTRSADVASVNTLSPWYNQTASTLYVEYVWEGFKGISNQRIISIDDGTINNFWAPQATSVAGLQGVVQVAGVLEATNATPATTFTANTVYKQALALELNNSVSALNGVAGTPDTAVSVPIVNTLRFATNTSGATNNIWFRRLTYYPRRLSGAELAAITA